MPIDTFKHLDRTGHLVRVVSVVVSCLMVPALAMAEPPSPVGVWKTINDSSGKAEALVKIVEVNGELRGSVEKLFRGPDEDQNPHCDKCSGDKKNAPILGMTILYGLRRGENGDWRGGEVLDPNNGATYHASLAVAPDNQSLSMRGYIGMPIFGRSQTWQRSE
jgi:uncharacterized protein (DUF2147 family)